MSDIPPPTSPTVGGDDPQRTLAWSGLARAPEADAPTVPARPAADPPLPDVAGYEVLGVLGRGGMGVVYKARQLGLNRLVALKMILAGAHADERERARFHAEAGAVAHLQHTNIVQIFEVGTHDGLPF